MSDTASNPVPASTMAMIRIMLVGAVGYAQGAGWLPAGSTESIVGFFVMAGTGLWGLYKTFNRQKGIKIAEQIIGAPLPNGKKL